MDSSNSGHCAEIMSDRDFGQAAPSRSQECLEAFSHTEHFEYAVVPQGRQIQGRQNQGGEDVPDGATVNKKDKRPSQIRCSSL